MTITTNDLPKGFVVDCDIRIFDEFFCITKDETRNLYLYFQCDMSSLPEYLKSDAASFLAYEIIEKEELELRNVQIFNKFQDVFSFFILQMGSFLKKNYGKQSDTEYCMINSITLSKALALCNVQGGFGNNPSVCYYGEAKHGPAKYMVFSLLKTETVKDVFYYHDEKDMYWGVFKQCSIAWESLYGDMNEPSKAHKPILLDELDFTDSDFLELDMDYSNVGLLIQLRDGEITLDDLVSEVEDEGVEALVEDEFDEYYDNDNYDLENFSGYFEK